MPYTHRCSVLLRFSAAQRDEFTQRSRAFHAAAAIVELRSGTRIAVCRNVARHIETAWRSVLGDEAATAATTTTTTTTTTPPRRAGDKRARGATSGASVARRAHNADSCTVHALVWFDPDDSVARQFGALAHTGASIDALCLRGECRTRAFVLGAQNSWIDCVRRANSGDGACVAVPRDAATDERWPAQLQYVLQTFFVCPYAVEAVFEDCAADPLAPGAKRRRTIGPEPTALRHDAEPKTGAATTKTKGGAAAPPWCASNGAYETLERHAEPRSAAFECGSPRPLDSERTMRVFVCNSTHVYRVDSDGDGSHRTGYGAAPPPPPPPPPRFAFDAHSRCVWTRDAESCGPYVRLLCAVLRNTHCAL